MQSTEAAFLADDPSLASRAKLEVADKARTEYFAALIAARNVWDAIADGEAKWSAEQNADDTEGCLTDQLRWLQIAIATHEEILSY